MIKLKILSFLLLILITSFLVVSVDVHAAAYDRYIYDSEMLGYGVTIEVDIAGSPLTSYDDYRLYWNETLGYIDFSSLYKATTTSTFVVDVEITSTNARFTTAYIYNTADDTKIYFDISSLSTSHWNYTNTTGRGNVYLDVFGDELEVNMSTDLNWQIRIIDNDFLTGRSTDHIYNAGFNAGSCVGIIIGKDLWFEDSFSGAVAGTDTFDDGSWNAGHAQGLIDSGNNTSTILGFIPAIFGLFLSFFMQLASINALGISILDLLVSFLLIIVGLAIFKMVLK
jgi:hypothetical protein